MELIMIVHTKSELESAINNGTKEIIIEGDLAEKVRNGRKIKTIGKITLIALTAAIAAIPFTGGTSAVGLVPIAAFTGLEITLIMAVFFVGMGLLTAIWSGYDEIEYSHNSLRLTLKKT
jgi:ABC-type polysaccharide/polyol phosphate export permease